MTFKDGRVTIVTRLGGSTFTSYKCNTSANPMEIDKSQRFVEEVDGRERVIEERTLKGIYRIEGDRLEMCTSLDAAGDRPSTFETKRGDRRRKIVAKRVD